jgi:hypothetical protein
MQAFNAAGPTLFEIVTERKPHPGAAAAGGGMDAEVGAAGHGAFKRPRIVSP